MNNRKNSKVLITGGAGFIGSTVIRQLINETDVNVDALTYVGKLRKRILLFLTGDVEGFEQGVFIC